MGSPPSREDPGSRPFPDFNEPETSQPEQGGGASQASTAQGAPPPPPLCQQLMGACRADERLRALLTLNISCAAADDRSSPTSPSMTGIEPCAAPREGAWGMRRADLAHPGGRRANGSAQP
ncbi:hypothetical protein ACP70R_032919 [Stipagrostis hirtigluma subsp. patula]